MGGYTHGEIASSLALTKLHQSLSEGRPSVKTLRQGIEAANLGVYQASQAMGAGRMGTTLTAACIVGDRLFLAHVGDSRAYLVRDQKATCLTQDHTTVGDMVRMHILPPSKVRTHFQRSVLTKAVGLALFIQPDISSLRLQEDDHLILCSDGVWSVIEDEEFAQLTAESASTQAISQNLTGLALSRQTDDNASAVAIHIRRLPSPAPLSNQIGDRSWPRFFRRFGARLNRFNE